MSLCPYCSVSSDDAWASSEHAIAVPPVEPFCQGHVVVAPRRHVPRFYDLDVEEQNYVWKLVSEVQRHVMAALAVGAVAVGFADSSDDQGHALIHIVPRYGPAMNLPGGIERIAQ